MNDLQSSLEIEQDNADRLCQENESLLLSVAALQQEKDALHAHVIHPSPPPPHSPHSSSSQIDELIASKDAVVNCIQKLTKENHRLKQKNSRGSSPYSELATPHSNPASPRMIDCPTGSDKTFSTPRPARRGNHEESPVTV
jgi:hypothetical protein